MIAHFEIIQGTEEWHRIKWGKIGGTRAHGLLVPSDTLLDDILSEYCEPFESDDSYLSEDMLRGMDLESTAREQLSGYIGIDLITCGWLQSEECELLGISPDGISRDFKISAEIKCFGRKKHTKTCRLDAIPREHIRQSIQYFTVTPKLEVHYFCAFRPEHLFKPLFVKQLTRESLVDIGLTEKVKVKRNDAKGVEKEYTETIPMVRTVQYWVEQNLAKAKELESQIKDELTKLEF
jgi:hypothetical protein